MTIKSVLSKVVTEKVVLILLLALSVTINAFLSREIVSVRNRVDLLTENRRLTIGEIAPILRTRDIKGEEVDVDFAGQQLPTVLYLQSTTCHWCAQNLENFKSLASQSTGKYRLVTLFLEPAIKADQRLFSSYQNLFDPTVESKVLFDLSSTPKTILFSPDGEVQKIWKGAYDTERKIEIEEVLGIVLPGLGNNRSLETSGD